MLSSYLDERKIPRTMYRYDRKIMGIESYIQNEEFRMDTVSHVIHFLN